MTTVSDVTIKGVSKTAGEIDYEITLSSLYSDTVDVDVQTYINGNRAGGGTITIEGTGRHTQSVVRTYNRSDLKDGEEVKICASMA